MKWLKNFLRSKKNRNILKWVLLAVAVAGAIGFVRAKIAPVDEETAIRQFYEERVDEAGKMLYTAFVDAMEAGLVDDVYYNTGKEYMLVTLYTDESKGSGEDRYQYDVADCRRVPYTASENFRENILQYDVNLILVRNEEENLLLSIMLSTVGPMLTTLLLLMWLMKRTTGSDNINANEIIQTSDVKLSDIIGHEEILDELHLIIRLIQDPSLGREIGCKIPHGILLSGPAGVGKTMIAKAISNEAKVPFLSMNGSDFQELYVGNGARRVRQLFKIANDKAPCIIFIDEFDAIGERRDSSHSGGEDTRTINAILKELDGFKPLDGVFVIAATNFPEKLDSSVTRSGRFDREVIIPAPKDWQIRKALFRHYLQDKKVMDDIDLDSLAKSVPGFTGADVANICNEAGLVALSHDKKIIDYECIEEAIGRRVFKGSYSKEDANDSDRQVVAYHEAGHAVMSILLKLPVSRASIRSTTSGVGGAVFNEDKESQFRTSEDMLNQVKVLYAGRVSERIKFNAVTTGAESDIQKATEVLANYVGAYGFSRDFGMVSYERLKQCGIDANDSMMPIIARMSRSAEDSTYSELKEHYDAVTALAEKLLVVGAMSGEEIMEFFEEENLNQFFEEL